MIREHEKLIVWQDAMDLVVTIYRFTRNLPKSEQYGLISQMQRASISVPANIAEGAARDSSKDYLRFLAIARGSLAELETLVKIAKRLGFGTDVPSVLGECNKVFAKLSALIESLKQKLNHGPGTSPVSR